MVTSWHVPMNNELSLEKELDYLKEKHRALDHTIASIGRDNWNELRLARLKKEKLQLRDKIHRIEAELYPDMPA